MTEHFAVQNDELHLLRNRYCYRKIKFKDLKNLNVSKDFEIKRWYILVLFGTVLITIDLYLVHLFLDNYNESFYTSGSSEVSEFLDSSKIKSFGVFFILIFFIGTGGIYSIISAFSRGYVLKVLTKGKKLHLPLKSFEKSNELFDFLKYLETSGFENLTPR